MFVINVNKESGKKYLQHGSTSSLIGLFGFNLYSEQTRNTSGHLTDMTLVFLQFGDIFVHPQDAQICAS